MFSLVEGVVTCGQILLGRGREKKCLFKTLFFLLMLLSLLLLYCLLGLGRTGGVGGLELQTDEDVAKKST